MKRLEDIIKESLEEDIGTGDITTNYLEIGNECTEAHIIAKEHGILAGSVIAEKVFLYLDNNLEIRKLKQDGEKIEKGDVILKIKGKKISILSGERTALNFLQRLSGIASITHKYIEQIKGGKTKILDTRKTTPLLRKLEKYAVRIGGGFNHRMGLYDFILIKENHIRSIGSIKQAVERIKQKNCNYKIEVETTNLNEVKQALSANVDRIMLDNMSISEIRQAVSVINNQCEVEVSGNINLKNVKEVSQTGVDYISIGALTHSARAFDFTLLFI